jgi:hypothetical protein
MVTTKIVLLILAFLLELLASLVLWADPPAAPRRPNLIAAGLACYFAALLFG